MIKLKKEVMHKIELDDGTSYDIKKIGKGRFATAYKTISAYNYQHYVFLVVPEDDFSKDILVDAWDKDTLTLPPVEYLGDTVNKRVFKMPYLQTISATDNRDAWLILKELESVRIDCWTNYFNNPYNGYKISYETIEKVRVPEYVKEDLSKLLSSMATYGSTWCFEFAKRNIGVDSKGIIQFRDCCFDIEALHRK